MLQQVCFLCEQSQWISRHAWIGKVRNTAFVLRGRLMIGFFCIRSPLLCEWEGNPDHIVYQHPYIVAISSQFIEVRHVETVSLGNQEGRTRWLIVLVYYRANWYKSFPGTTFVWLTTTVEGIHLSSTVAWRTPRNQILNSSLIFGWIRNVQATLAIPQEDIFMAKLASRLFVFYFLSLSSILIV